MKHRMKENLSPTKQPFGITTELLYDCMCDTEIHCKTVVDVVVVVVLIDAIHRYNCLNS